MLSFTTFLLGLTSAVGAFALPTAEQSDVQALKFDKRSTGYNNGYYYEDYSDGQSDVVYTNEAGGEYNVKWDGNGDFVVGKGWNPGSAQAITYSGQWGSTSADGNLGVYGWFTNPLVEYYITDSWVGYNPGSAGTHLGTVYSDGSTYDIYETTRTNEPSIEGTSTFHQYISVRQNQRVGGTITTSNHFSAWESLGLPIGTFNLQIVATEAWSGSGESDITVETAA